MEDLVGKMQQAGDSLKGCGIQDALADIPFTEHLQAIRDLQKANPGKTNLDIQIKDGSTPTDFDLSIYANGPSKNMMSDLAKKLGMDDKEFEGLTANARKGMAPQLLLHEKFQINAATNKFTLDIKCNGK